MESTEKWLPVVGFEQAYEVSDHGNVRSIDRVNTRGFRMKGKQLTLKTDAYGYKAVTLSWGNKPHTRKVHHLVLEAFVGPRVEGSECLHADGVRDNNHVSNLRWGTHLENEADKAAHGTHPRLTRTHCPRGHVLAEPNLVRVSAQAGHRSCLACSREHAAASWHGRPFDTESADARYAEILAGSAPVAIPAKLRTHCPRGHALKSPNLTNARKRQCLSCARERALARAQGREFDKALADARYQDLLPSD